MMDEVESEVLSVLRGVLGPNLGAAGRDAAAPLLGAVPELDSMAVVSILTGLEDRFGLNVDDDVDASAFASVRSLADYVRAKLKA